MDKENDNTNTDKAGSQAERPEQQTAGIEQHGELGAYVADPLNNGSHCKKRYEAEPCGNWKENWLLERDGEWTTQPPICGRDDGVSRRVDRLKGLGNSIVPQVAARLMQLMQ